MAFQVYENLGGPNVVLTKIRDFVVAHGWTVLENLTEDLAVDGSGTTDGLRLSINKGDIYANFRSANGKGIFPEHLAGPDSGKYGIGLTCSTNYTSNPPSGYWYDQPNVTKNTAQKVIGVGIPVKQDHNVKLFCNYISDPVDMMIFTLELEAGTFQHLAVGTTQKVGAWLGGTLYSGSRNSYTMFPGSWSMPAIEAESNHLFGMSKKASTFLRADIDAAPLRTPAVLWASAGPNTSELAACFTGKMLASGVTNLDCIGLAWFPKVPHFGYLQSQDSKDTGRNVNTLNCISVNMPMTLYVQRDPDALLNFSQVGYVPGIYAISLRNVSPGQIYEIGYPNSGNLHQVFPHVRRGGAFGYDGISIKQ